MREQAMARLGAETVAMRSALERAHADGADWREAAERTQSELNASQTVVAQQQAVLASMRAVAAEEEEDGDDDGDGTQSRARKRGAMRDSSTMPQSPLPLTAPSSSSSSTSSLSSPHKLAAVEALHAEIARLRSQLSDASSSSSSSAADLKAAAEQWRLRFESAQRDADERATALTAARAGNVSARAGVQRNEGNHKHYKLHETFLNEHEPILSHTQPLCLLSSISDLCAL